MMHARTQGRHTQLEWLFSTITREISRLCEHAQALPEPSDRVRMCAGLNRLMIACETTSIAALDFEDAVRAVLAMVARPDVEVDQIVEAIAESLGQMYVDYEILAAARKGD